MNLFGWLALPFVALVFISVAVGADEPKRDVIQERPEFALLRAKRVSIDPIPDREGLVATFPTDAAGRFTSLAEVAPLLKTLERVVALEFTDAAFRDDTFATLAQVPSVDTLVLRRCTKADVALASIPQLADMKAINLEGSDLTDAGVAHLAKFKQLRELNLQETRITTFCLGDIGSLVRLQTLNLAHTEALRYDPKGLAALTSLRILDLTNTHAKDSTLESLIGAGELRVLKLANSNVRNDGLRHLSAFPHLRTLDVDQTRVGTGGIKHLRGLKELSELRIVSFLPTALALREIKSEVPSLDTTPFVLQAIYVDFTRDEKGRITSLSFFRTSQFDVLRELCVSRALLDVVQIDSAWELFTDETAQLLPHLPNLEEVDLHRAAITDASVDSLLKLPKLRRVTFRTGQISAAGVERLQNTGVEVDLITLAEPRRPR